MLLSPPTVVPPLADESAEVRTQVWGLLATLYPRVSPVERRREHRYPFPHLLQLTPVAADGRTPCGPTIVVAGKQISELGISFFHTAPIAERRVIATLAAANGARLAFLVDLSWCRFAGKGWYESGGRFLEAALPPE